MKVVVGLINLVKVEVVREVFLGIYGDVEVVFIEVDSGVFDQFVGLEEIVKGVINRVKQVIEKIDVDFGVGIEVGFYWVLEMIIGYMDVQFCVVVDWEGRIIFGYGLGFEYFLGVIRWVFEEGVEVGIVMGELVNDFELKRKIGVIGVLIYGMFVRKELNKLVVLMVLVLRLNFEWYGL